MSCSVIRTSQHPSSDLIELPRALWTNQIPGLCASGHKNGWCKNKAAVALGSVQSERKAKAARTDGAKGPRIHTLKGGSAAGLRNQLSRTLSVSFTLHDLCRISFSLLYVPQDDAALGNSLPYYLEPSGLSLQAALFLAPKPH